MAEIRRFEELDSWKIARSLSNRIYDLSDDGIFSRHFGLKDQVRRSAGSVMHNIAEGFDAGSDKVFARYLGIARQSASQVQSQLYLALDRGYIEKDQFSEAFELATRAKQLINALIGYLTSQSRRIREKDGLHEIDDELDELDE